MAGRDFNDVADKTADKAHETVDQANRAAKNANETAREKAEQAERVTREKAEQADRITREKAEQADRYAREKAGEAERIAKQKAQQVERAAKDAEQTVLQKLREDGVENPAGLSLAAFGGLFLAAIPLTSWIAQPNSLVEKAVNGVVGSVGWLSSAGSTSTIPQTGKIAALAGLYVTVTYALSGAGSAAGQASSAQGRDNNHPRANVTNLRGLPLRLYSAHYNLLEMFPSWAISAALAQAIAPSDQSLINLLGLHVISKVFVYYPSYIFNVSVPRTLAHIVATASVINVALRLAKKPLI